MNASMENFKNPEVQFGELVDFDQKYFQSIDRDGWLALGNDEYENVQYFTAVSRDGAKLGIIGKYDFGEEKNVVHIVVDPKYRGLGWARKLESELMEITGVDFLTLTIDLDNESSLRSVQKLPGVKRISDERYEKDYHKAKFIYEKTTT